MSKKFLSLLIVAALMVTVLIGCGESKENLPADQGKKDEVKTDVESVDVKKVFVSPEWVKSVIDGKEKEVETYAVLEVSQGKLKDTSDYSKGHIPGALYANLDNFEEKIYRNFVSPEQMEKSLLNLGITKDTLVILYSDDIVEAARLATGYIWAGVENVKVLNGGRDAWTSAGFDLETKENTPVAATEFGTQVPAKAEVISSIEDVKENIEKENFRLVSIRSQEEFLGETSGYTYIAKAGEPKGAVWGKGSLDMKEYINEDGRVINMEELMELWKDLDFNLDNDLSFYCGTGWRASLPFLIMYENGYTNMNIYDGGWYRWQMDDSLPVQVGDPATEEVEYTTVGELSNENAAE